jgi:hypothetical protein
MRPRTPGDGTKIKLVRINDGPNTRVECVKSIGIRLMISERDSADSVQRRWK